MNPNTIVAYFLQCLMPCVFFEYHKVGIFLGGLCLDASFDSLPGFRASECLTVRLVFQWHRGGNGFGRHSLMPVLISFGAFRVSCVARLAPFAYEPKLFGEGTAVCSIRSYTQPRGSCR